MSHCNNNCYTTFKQAFKGNRTFIHAHQFGELLCYQSDERHVSTFSFL